MPNPKYENVSQMEAAAACEDDDTVSLRLRNHRADGTNGGSVWLRVVYFSTGAYHFYIDGKRTREIGPNEAQRLIDREWGKVPSNA